MPPNVYIIRHGETAWSTSGRHTGRTEVPLTERGEAIASRLKARLASAAFSHVFVSPRQRAARTCELAGWGASAVVVPDLAEWDYGDYEGLRSSDIHKTRPGWNLFRDGCPAGESPADVSARADRLIARLRTLEGTVALFSHGHFGRAVAARWVELPVGDGERFLLDPCGLGILGYEKNDPAAPVLSLWNELPPESVGGQPGAAD
jgi:broad specificity phosphatase PhoE